MSTIKEFETTTIPPQDPTRHTHTVIFLHGRGDNTRSFIRALHNWYTSEGLTIFTSFPTLRFIFPQAPVRPLASTASSFRQQAWPQWFDVWTPQDFSEREEIQIPGLQESVGLVREMVRREAEVLGGRWDRVVLAGISMGAATSVHTVLNLDVPVEGGGRLAALMGFCGRCPFAGRGLAGMRAVLGLGGVPGDDGVLRRTPVLLEHNVDDPLVKIENGRGLRDTLVGFGMQVEWREYPKGGHWFQEPQGIENAVAFLKKVVTETGSAEASRAAGNGEAMDLD